MASELGGPLGRNFGCVYERFSGRFCSVADVSGGRRRGRGEEYDNLITVVFHYDFPEYTSRSRSNNRVDRMGDGVYGRPIAATN